MNNIQKYIDLLTLRKENAKAAVEYWQNKDKVRNASYVGMSLAFSFAIEQAELLLKEETAKDLPCKHDYSNGDHVRDTCKHCGEPIWL